jgi:hypothetical protein
MPLAGFEPAIPASEKAKTHALARAASRIGEPLHKNFNPICLYDTELPVD